MKLLNYKIFFTEEFFGSRIYNTKDQKEYFFDKEATANIKKIFSDDFKKTLKINEVKNDLIKKGLLTSDIVYIKNNKNNGLSSPLRISINITRKCNLRCKDCLTDAGNPDPDELTTKELFRLIDQMKEAGSFFLAIGGGEPLLRKDLFQVIKYARKNFIATSIVTNGLLINKEMAKKLNDLDLNKINISIDGLEINHNYIRGEGTYKRTIEKIKILRKYFQTAPLAMRVTINRLNIDEYKQLLKLAEQLSFDLIRFTPMLSLGRAKENQDLLIGQEEYIRFLNNVYNIKSKIKMDLPGGEERKWFTPPTEFGCHCGKEVCWITQTGDLYPCIFFGNDYKVGNIKNEKLLDLWTKSKSRVELSGNEICNNCSNFKKCRGGCRARALSYYQDINTVDPLCPLRRNKLIN